MAEALDVRHAGRTVGRLSAPGGRLAFVYDAAWLADPQAFALSPRLPRIDGPCPPDEVAFFFANLLPEGPVLDALCALQRLPRGNLFRLLAAFGRECAGAFEIVDPDAPQVERTAGYLPYDADMLAADLAALQRNVPLLHRHGELRLSLAGAQNKIPVRFDGDALWLPSGGAPSTHILKPPLPPQFPDSVHNEAACMRLAAAVGLTVAKVEVFAGPQPLLLVERYDRVERDGAIDRLHQLDLCQLGGWLPAQKYEADGGPGFADAFRLIDELSPAPALERLKAVDWLVFNFLIGNADAHGKNLSMLNDDRGLRLAPVYDLLAIGYWPTISTKMAMRIGGESRPDWVMPRHWQRLCSAVRLNLTQLRRRALQLADAALAALPGVLNSLAVSTDAPLASHLQRTLEQRRRWVDARLVAVE